MEGAWPARRGVAGQEGRPVCERVFLASLPALQPSASEEQFDRNVERDERNLEELRKAGWTVHVIWECQLKKKEIDATFAELLPQLSKELGKPLRELEAEADK